MIDYIIDYVNDAVALRKESVDRNVILPAVLLSSTLSLSARRAWIEISTYVARLPRVQVALRKESVDRNACSKLLAMSIPVALRKESVDRNGLGIRHLRDDVCRSPQGERG